MLSITTIKNDCETIKALIPAISQPIIGLSFLPYFALFCMAISEYYRSKGLMINLDNNSPFSVSDIRNKLKLFDDKYGKMQKQILTVDNIQDMEFKNKLRFPILKYLNLHYNLGIFVNEDKYIIGNTQYMYYMFQDKRFSKRDIKGEQVKEFSRLLGTLINSVSQGLKNFEPNFHVDIYQRHYPVFYQDFNTNRNFNFFQSYKNGKDFSLRLLHVLCSVNFARYVLDEFVSENNIWSLRIKYIIMYYAYRSVEKLVKYLPNNTIRFAPTEYMELLDGEFRSCMMHYTFINKDSCIISDDYLDHRTPFFGLIESRFNGMSYDCLCKAINQKITILSDILSEAIRPNFTNCKPL